MLILKTSRGDYLLNNALKVDVFKTHNKIAWEVYLTIDAHKHLLHCFESETDAFVFTECIRNELLDFISHGYEISNLLNLSHVCKKALREVLELEKEEIK